MRNTSFLNAIKWAYTANLGERGFSALFVIVLAAILGPRDFGIVAVAMIYITFVQMLLEQGFVAALIQKKDLKIEHLNAVFWMNVVLSLVLIGSSFFFSHWWAKWNNLPELVPIIMALSACIIFKALSTIQAVKLKREMDFKSLSVRANISVLASGVIGVVMAFAGCGVWALVVQQISREFISLLLLWKLSSWRPTFSFSWQHLKELVGFSLAIFITQLGQFADAQAGALLLGLLFGPLAVGLYRMAERLMNTVMVVATSSIQWVSLPEFSRLQGDPEALRNSVLTCIRISSTVTIPAMAGMAVVSDSLMATLGAEWIPAADTLKILCVLGMFLMLSFFTGPLLQALARPQIGALLEWIRSIAGVGFIAIAGYLVQNTNTETEIMGIALARFANGAFLVTPIFLFVLLKTSKLTIRRFVGAIAPATMTAAIIVISVYSLQYFNILPNEKPLISLVTQILVGGISGITVLLSIDEQLRKSVSGVLQKLIKTVL